MEETLGKRISANRKRLGLTQDRLAELLGVTAQAVSKWENDQSCPDIGTLPRLAEIFGISTDELLGRERPVETTVEPLGQKPCSYSSFWERHLSWQRYQIPLLLLAQKGAGLL